MRILGVIPLKFFIQHPNLLLRMTYMSTWRQVRVALTQTFSIDVRGQYFKAM